MKKILLLVGMVPVIIASAQMKEGRVVYKREVQIQFQGRNNNDELSKQIPKGRVDRFEVLFGNNHSLAQLLPELNSDGGQFTASDGNRTMQFVIPGSNDITFVDFDSKRSFRQTDLFDQNYIIESNIAALSWKLTNETKFILGHPVTKATAMQIGTRPIVTMENGEMKRRIVADTSAIVAWFAQDIPVPAGPDLQGQLPGLIMELDLNNGQTHFTAEEISPKVSLASIKEPKKGKKVSQQEFDKERDKKLEEMKQYGGNRAVRMF